MTKIITLVFALLMTANIISQSAFAQATFSAKTDFATGTNPQSVSINDFNGDGKRDLAVANYVSSTASVFLNTTATGNAVPTFSAKTDFSTGAFCNFVTSGDLNGDGKPDLVVANNSNTTVTVFLNTTTPGAVTPTFSAKTDFTGFSGPTSISLCDMNGDGKLDMVVINYSSAFVSVMMNTTTTGAATPTFSARTDFSIGTNVYSVSTADYNGDGKLDIVTSNNGSLSILLNTTTTGAATPTFSANTNFTISSGASIVSVCDLNNDGKPDLTASAGGAAQACVFLNTTTPGASTPTFTTRQNFTTGNQPNCVAAGDINGDGKQDFVTANNADNTISVLMNTMTLGVTPSSFSGKTDFVIGNNPLAVTTSDFNGDGKPDIVAGYDGISNVSVLLNTTTPGASTPTFSAKTDFATSDASFGVSAKDLNGDGKPDIVAANYGSNSVSVFLNTTTPGASTPTFSAKTDFVTGTNPFSTTFGDFNGDGKPDMVVANSFANSISVYFNTTTPGASTPTFTAKTDYASGFSTSSVSTGDFNGDGKLDIVCVGPFNGFSVYFNTTTPGAGTPSFSAKTDFFALAQSSSVGDLNGDGKPDMVSANTGDNSASVFLNTTTPGSSTPTFSARTDFTTATGPQGVILRDLNGDGKSDIATANSAGNISVLLNTTTPGSSTPTFSANTDFTAGDNPYSISSADFNGDGKPDLVTANYGTNTLSVLLNTAVLPLPVELASFTSVVNRSNVTLSWSTVQELNNKGFEIERNSFGAGWKKVGYTEGHGTINSAQNYTFKDNNLTTGRYSYRLKQIDYNGNFEYYELSNEVVIGTPDKYLLAQNYPNPFNPVTRINYELPITNYVSLKIYDITGKEVSSLVNEVKDAGYYTVTFDAKNLSSGTYFYKLNTDKFSDVKKMVVLK
ncbi:MAG: T9SS type A sorting domain-containing protein [Ignavibacteria bacterium]|nr:T9SS type A sorting domain-containing protein [Ignavibacteria bacterium]